MISPGTFAAGRAMQAAYGPRVTVEHVRAQLAAEARANPNMRGAADRLDALLVRLDAYRATHPAAHVQAGRQG